MRNTERAKPTYHIKVFFSQKMWTDFGEVFVLPRQLQIQEYWLSVWESKCWKNTKTPEIHVCCFINFDKSDQAPQPKLCLQLSHCWNLRTVLLNHSVINVCFDFEVFWRYYEWKTTMCFDHNQSFMGACVSFSIKTTQPIPVVCSCGCSFFGPFFLCYIWSPFLCCNPLPINPESPLSSRCPLHPKTMCGVSFQLPPRWRRAPNKKKQLSLLLLGPGSPPLSLLNSPLPPAGPGLRSLLSEAVSVTISWTEGLLSASGVERLADFRLHVSFKGLCRGKGTWRFQHEGEGAHEREIKGRQESEVAQWMMACSGTRLELMCAAWWGRGMDGLAAGGWAGFTVPALNYFNWSH